MLKYVNEGIVFQEIPDEVTLSINISNCPCHCPGCHSSYLWGDIGLPLDNEAVDKFMSNYGNNITCICFMGGDAEPEMIDNLANYVKLNYIGIHVGWYSGKTILSPYVHLDNFDYIKIGPYIRHLGGLNKTTTNQRLYKVEKTSYSLVDITHKFWKK